MNAQSLGRLPQRNSALLFFLTIVQFASMLVITVVCRQTIFGVLLAFRCLLFPRLQYHTPLRKRLITQPSTGGGGDGGVSSRGGNSVAAALAGVSSNSAPLLQSHLQSLNNSPVMVNVYATATVTKRHRIFLWVLLMVSLATLLFMIIFAIVEASMLAPSTGLAGVPAVWPASLRWLPNH